MPRPLAARFLISCALVAVAVVSTAADPAPRTWSDATGRFKIKGTFVSLENDVVTILKEDGKEVEIPLRKLGPADQALAKAAAESAAENPFREKGREASPFVEKGSKPGVPVESSADSTAEPAPLRTGPVEVDWNAAEALDPQPEASNWADAIKPGQLVEGAPVLKSKTARLPNRVDFFEKAQAVAFSPSGAKAVVGYTLQKPGVDQSVSTRLALVDAKTGKSLGSGQTDGEYVPLGLSDDGRRLFVRKEKFGFGESDQLEVWGLGKGGILRGMSWTPHDDQEGSKRDVKWGAIVADGRGVSLGAAGRLAMWDLEEGQAVWYLDLPREHTPALSPNRKYLAYAAEGAVGLLDLVAGSVLAMLPTEPSMLTALAFSPDGKFLAGTSHDTLWVWDAATGALHREVEVRNFAPAWGLAWTDPAHVLVGNSTLIHVESRIPVWQYTGGTAVQAAGGVTWFLLSSQGGEALVGAELPHSAAKKAVELAMADPNFFMLSPGSAVALDVSGIPDADRAAVSEKLRKSITNAGFTIAGSAPVTVKATTGRGETREMRYHRFGSFNDETHSVQEYVLGVAFVAGGKNAWETKHTHLPAPFFVSLKKDQTIADLIRESDKPNYDFFGTVRLPKFVPRPSERPVLGTTAVAVQGIR